VFDTKWEKELRLMGVGLGKYLVVNDIVRERVEKETVKADTIDELARKMDVPLKTFKAEVERYNQSARTGRDMDFGKRADRLTTIDEPPFYAGLSKQEFLVVLEDLTPMSDYSRWI
jgi:fumarate reductase flavoprotein subunit